jgi:hypothetical protein
VLWKQVLIEEFTGSLHLGGFARKLTSSLQVRAAMSWQDTPYQAHLKSQLSHFGTDVQKNEDDPYGDGDQSRIPGYSNREFYRELFSTGGDLNHIADLNFAPLSMFAIACITGMYSKVQKMLEEVAGKNQDVSETPSPELIQLLERRETCLRLTPLLMVVSMGKNLRIGNASTLDSQQVKVVELLLKYGARPDARDVCGKTVCHYGMGAMATRMTMDAVELCVQAQESSHLFGKEVELVGLKTASMNGQQGWCKGFVTESGRRAVYLPHKKQTITVKPANLKLISNDGTTIPKPINLCDITDRLGAVCLLEVIQADRTDVAEKLLNDFNPNLDIEDCDGVSPRNMSIAMAMVSSVAEMVKKAATRRAIQERNDMKMQCSKCGKKESAELKMKCCAKCKIVQYCSSECQIADWNARHKKECKKLRNSKSKGIVLNKPEPGGMWFATINFAAMQKGNGRSGYTAPQTEADGYRKPTGVGVDENFDIKVQCADAWSPLMLYDKSREFNISVNPGSPGFSELVEACSAEPTWQGRKTFVAASFDESGNCTVYPHVRSIHEW